MAELLSEEKGTMDRERYERATETIRRLCQRVGRILTGDQGIVVKSHYGSGPAPAWIINKQITMAHDVITGMVSGDMTDRMKITICLLFHELGHYRFDPKPENPIWREARKELKRSGEWARVAQELNVLNDQRHEIMTAGVYPVARDYFRDATLRSMQLVIKMVGGIPTENYLLYYGRRHILPAPILVRLREAMVIAYGETKTARAEALINEYLPLTLSSADVQRMIDIAVELSNMFPPPQTEDCLGIGKTGEGSNQRTAEKASGKVREQLAKADKGEQDKAQKPQDIDEKRDAGALGDPQTADEAKDEQDDSEEGDEGAGDLTEDEVDDLIERLSAADDAEGDDADADADGDADADADAKDDAEGDKDDAEGDKDAEGDGTDAQGASGDDDAGDDAADSEAPSKGAGMGDPTDKPKDTRPLEDMIDDAAVEAGNALDRDVTPYIEALRHALDDVTVKDGDLSEHIKAQADRLTRMFEKINVDLDLTEVYGLKSGRLDMRRVVPAMINGGDRIFRKRQEEMTDEAKMGVFIAIDASGSMSGKLNAALDTGLTIGRGAENAGHMVKIIAFDSDAPYQVVKSWFGKQYHSANVVSGGGTPFAPFLKRLNAELDALHSAERIRHSVVFIVTDGGHGESEEEVRRFMRTATDKHATHIYWIGIGMAPKQYKEVERVIAIKRVGDLQHAMQGVLRDLAVRIRDDVREGR